MFTTAFLISVALAHSKLITPAPKFLSPDENNFPSYCTKIAYHNDAPAKNIQTFSGMLNEKYGGSLLKYFEDCGSDSPKTDHNAEVPIPTDGLVVMDNHSHHPGLYEMYIDDIKVASGVWQDGEQPATLPIDYSKCTSGKCKFRYMMAAVHAQPIQLYDNIVTIVGKASPTAPADTKPTAPASGSVYSSAPATTKPSTGSTDTKPSTGSTDTKPSGYSANPVITSSATYATVTPPVTAPSRCRPRQ